MHTVTLELGSPETALDAFRKAWTTGQGEETAHISFAAPELLWKLLTAKRWDLLKAMTGQGPVTIRGAARLVGRDVKAVHGDTQALLAAGLLRRTEDGRIEFPFEAVHVDFMLRAA